MRTAEDEVLEIPHCLVPEVLSVVACLPKAGEARSPQLRLDLEEQQECLFPQLAVPQGSLAKFIPALPPRRRCLLFKFLRQALSSRWLMKGRAPSSQAGPALGAGFTEQPLSCPSISLRRRGAFYVIRKENNEAVSSGIGGGKKQNSFQDSTNACAFKRT